jgi:hypothetical protein
MQRDHLPFVNAVQLLETRGRPPVCDRHRGDDNSRWKVQNIHGDSWAHHGGDSWRLGSPGPVQNRPDTHCILYRLLVLPIIGAALRGRISADDGIEGSEQAQADEASADSSDDAFI